MEVIQRNHPKRKDGENNETLNIRVNTLTNKLTEKEEEIDNLTSDNNYLKPELTKRKNRFLNIINFIKNRLLRPKDKDTYKEFTISLYTHKAITQETFDDLEATILKTKEKMILSVNALNHLLIFSSTI